MVYNREGYAPWSLTRKAGVQSATVDGDIEVPQYIQPTLDTGFVDDKGDWKGRVSSDELFIGQQTDLAIANGGDALTQTTMDCLEYDNIMFALKVSNAGNFVLSLMVSGSETGNDSYLNLKPVNTNFFAFATLRTDSSANLLDQLLVAENAYDADVWNIVKINEVKGFKLIMKVTNSSGGNSDIETAFMRIV
jgi:hypothetical protein